MKRCPQCEFIYEDEQTTCDMDGSMLALDQPRSTIEGQRSSLKSFVLPAVAGTTLAVVLFVAFYASPLLVAKPDARQLSPEQTIPANPVPVSTPKQPAIEEPSPSPKVVSEPDREEQVGNPERSTDANHANSKSGDSQLTIRRGLPPLPRVPSLPRLPPARVRKSPTVKDVERENNQVVSTQPKKQSKVGSFLKKTGRVITRPFKF